MFAQALKAAAGSDYDSDGPCSSEVSNSSDLPGEWYAAGAVPEDRSYAVLVESGKRLCHVTVPFSSEVSR